MSIETKAYLIGDDIGSRAAATFMIRHGKLPGGFVETFLAQAFKCPLIFHYPASRHLWAQSTRSIVSAFEKQASPWAAGVLRFSALPVYALAAACALGLLSVLWFEVVKWARRA